MQSWHLGFLDESSLSVQEQLLICSEVFIPSGGLINPLIIHHFFILFSTSKCCVNQRCYTTNPTQQLAHKGWFPHFGSFLEEHRNIHAFRSHGHLLRLPLSQSLLSILMNLPSPSWFSFLRVEVHVCSFAAATLTARALFLVQSNPVAAELVVGVHVSFITFLAGFHSICQLRAMTCLSLREADW